MKPYLLLGSVLGSILLAASCVSPTDDDAPPAPDEPVAAAAAAVEEAPGAATVAARPKRARLANGLLPGMKPWRGGIQIDVTPACKSPKLAYFDGPIIQAPQVVTVFWSSHVNTALTAATTGIGQFFTDVLASTSYLGWLQEYDTVGITGGTEQAMLPGAMIGTVTLTPSLCASTAKCTVSDTDIQNELNAQITSGVLPAPVKDCTGNTQTLYMISFPPNVTITGPDGSGTSCANGGFCAYHNTGTYGTSTPLLYGVLPDEFTSGCDQGCGNGSAMQNTTSTASHELVEAMTDPDIGLDTQNGYAAPAGWGDNNNSCGEIADICDTGASDTITVSGRTWSVQELWSNEQGKCTSTGTAPAVCSGTTVTNCRKCSCGDNGGACSGGTSVCETTSSNVLFGACEQCTSKSNTCGGGTCEQSSTPADDDICSCTPKTACPTGDNCGTVSDGCGGMVDCGSCTSPETCGGGSPSNPNVCGCTPLRACPTGDTCGTVPDGCGGTVTCGSCASPQTCGGGSPSNPNVCGCTPLTACPAGDTCGTVPDGCGATVTCGACTGNTVCSGNQCVASTSETSTSAATGSGSTSSGTTGAGNGGSGATSSSGEGGSTGSGTTGSFTQPTGCHCATAGNSPERSSSSVAAFGVLALAGMVRSRKRRRG